MTIILTTHGRPDGLDTEIERVSDLILALGRLRDRILPQGSVFAEAPLLEDWSAAARMFACLAGRPHDHPHLFGRVAAVTSPLCLVSLDHGFARTATHFWRHGDASTGASDDV